MAHLLRSEVATLSREWLVFARSRLPAALAMSEGELRDSVHDLLLAVADDLENSQNAVEQADKSLGVAPENAAGLDVVARAHANGRVQAGFTLDQVLGEFRALRASVLRLVSVQDDPQRYTIDDITRFNESIDEALAVSAAFHGQRVSRARDMFIAVLSHDLRDPLNAIKMSSSHMLLLDGLDPECLKVGQQVMRSTLRMTRMMDDLLDFTRARSGVELPLAPGRVDFADICRTVVAESSAAHPSSSILLDCPKVLIGKWDSARLGQLVANLLANAVAYGAPGRPVGLSLQDDGQGRAVLTVHNEGHPIPPAELEVIFDPLTRGVHSTSDHATRAAGLGLGLSIVKSITTAHQGTISVRSTAVSGTSFVVVLPKEW